MRKSVMIVSAVQTVICTLLVFAMSLSPTMRASGPYIHPFGSSEMWLAVACLAAVLLLPAAVYALGLRWMKYLLAFIIGALAMAAIILLGLMVVLVLLHRGGEGWFIMGFDWWYLLMGVLGIAQVVGAFFWFRTAFSGKQAHHHAGNR